MFFLLGVGDVGSVTHVLIEDEWFIYGKMMVICIILDNIKADDFVSL